jgi:hypothetical protein
MIMNAGLAALVVLVWYLLAGADVVSAESQKTDGSKRVTVEDYASAV